MLKDLVDYLRPLDNYEAVRNAILIFTNDQGFGISPRRVTVSTCGLVHLFKELAEDTKARLAVSLHSAQDLTRSELMPINRKYNVEKLLTACRDYYRITKKHITFEYTLMKDVNDTLDQAKTLVKQLKTIPCKVNLIPFNPHPGSQFKTSDPKTIQAFQNYLLNNNIRTMVRTTRGQDIAAACGQLAGRSIAPS